MRDTIRSIERLPASYFSLQFLFSRFFSRYSNVVRRSAGEGEGEGKGGRRQEGKCARHVAAETFVIRDGASSKVEFSQREECLRGGERKKGALPPFERR